MINHIHELLFCGIVVLYSFKCIEGCLLLSNVLVFLSSKFSSFHCLQLQGCLGLWYF